MDYGHGGLLSTLKYLDSYGFEHAGTGENLAKASTACHYETKGGRIALINVTSSFHDSYLAGPQNQDVCGRPGVSPLRHKAVYNIPYDDYRKLSEIIINTGINSYHDMARKSGYLTETENLSIGYYNFKPARNYSLTTTPAESDLERTIAEIHEAHIDSDIVIVSIHSHQFCNDIFGSPQFIETFARECCEEGADVVFCHGPHVVRGIEAYRGKLILYGLGNFFFQHEGMDYLPEELYIRYGTKRSDVSGVQALFAKRNKNGKIGLSSVQDPWKSFIANVTIDNNELIARLIPIDIMKDEICKGFKGLPKISENTDVLFKVAQLSEKYGTHIDIKDNIGEIIINR